MTIISNHVKQIIKQKLKDMQDIAEVALSDLEEGNDAALLESLADLATNFSKCLGDIKKELTKGKG